MRPFCAGVRKVLRYEIRRRRAAAQQGAAGSSDDPRLPAVPAFRSSDGPAAAAPQVEFEERLAARRQGAAAREAEKDAATATERALKKQEDKFCKTQICT